MSQAGDIVAVIGAGGHANVVVGTLLDAGFTELGVFDDDRTRHGKAILGVPISSTEELMDTSRPAIVAVGDNDTRRIVTTRFKHLGWITAVHPSAVVHPSVQLGVGTVVFAGSVIQPHAQIGNHVIVNTGVTVDHDCVVEDFVHLAPGTHVAGEVHIEEGAFLGVGCSVVPKMRIGEWSTVGAGGVVTRNIPNGATAVGVPARAIPEESR